MAEYELQFDPRYQRETSSDGGSRMEDKASTNVLDGAEFQSVEVPSSVVAGGEIKVTGEMAWDALPVAKQNEMRVVATTSIGEERTAMVGSTKGGTKLPFDIKIPAPSTAGESVTVTLEAQANYPVGGWSTDDTDGPYTVNAVSEGQKAASSALGYAPWMVGGGGAGYLVSSRTGRSPMVGAATGAALGLGAKQVTAGGVVPDVDFPTVPVVATAVLLGAGGYLVSTSGLGKIGQVAASGAGKATRAAAKRASNRR